MKVLIPSLLTINRALLPVKIHFFLFYAATGCGLPFRTVYAKQLGISGSAIGATFAATSLFRLFTNPLFGIVMDKLKKFRLTIGISLVIVSTSHLAMTFIQPASRNDSNPSETDICDAVTEAARSNHIFTSVMNHTLLLPSNQTLQLSVLKLSTNKSSEISCTILHDQTYLLNHSMAYRDKNGTMLVDDSNSLLDTTYDTFYPSQKGISQRHTCCRFDSCITVSCAASDISAEELVDESESYEPSLDSFVSPQFALFMVLMLISASSTTAVIFMMDAVCYEMLDDKPEKYGAQRLFGTLGWGIGGLVGGYLNQLFTSPSSDTDYTPCFYMLAALSSIDLIPIAFVKVKNAKQSPSIWKETRKVMGNVSVAVYVTMVFFAGVLSGPVWNYGFWFLEEIGASQSLLGLAHIVECFLSEMPCFLLSGWIIRKIGFINCNSLAFLFFGLRYLSFFYMYDPWWSLPVGLLHGPTFGLFYASATAFAKKNAPPGAEGTAQAIVAAAFESLGVAVGSVLCGMGFDHVGYRYTFLYTSIASFALLLINVALQHLLFDFDRKETEDLRTKATSEMEMPRAVSESKCESKG